MTAAANQINNSNITYVYKTIQFSFPINFTSIQSSTLIGAHITPSSSNTSATYGLGQIGLVKYVNYANEYRLSIIDPTNTSQITNSWAVTIIGLGW